MFVRGNRGYFYESATITIVEGIVAPPHQHGVIQLVVSLDDAPCSMGPDLDDLREGKAHLVASNQLHALHGHEGLQAVLLLPQESAVGRQLTAEYLQNEPIVTLPWDLFSQMPLDAFRRAYEESWSLAEFRAPAFDFVRRLRRSVPDAPTALHPAVRKAVRIIHRLEQKRISADELSAAVGLSRSHFLRTFSEHMGIPLRPYLQWLRLRDAFALLLHGRNVAEAAAEAGFTDSAHLHRVCRKTMAMKPMQIMKMRQDPVRFLVDWPLNPDIEDCTNMR